MTSIPLVSRTRATLRSAEFGFFGRGRVDARADAAALGAALERRRLVLRDLVLPALADQLLDRGHAVSVFVCVHWWSCGRLVRAVADPRGRACRLAAEWRRLDPARRTGGARGAGPSRPLCRRPGVGDLRRRRSACQATRTPAGHPGARGQARPAPVGGLAVAAASALRAAAAPPALGDLGRRGRAAGRRSRRSGPSRRSLTPVSGGRRRSRSPRAARPGPPPNVP